MTGPLRDEDLTLAALDRLTPAERRNLEAVLAANPSLASELREVEDTVTAVWRASAPLQSAPPDTYESIRRALHPETRAGRVPVALAIGGWAAAVVLLVLSLARPGTDPAGADSPSPPAAQPAHALPPVERTPSKSEDRNAEERLRARVRELQQQLLAAGRSRAPGASPRVRELRAPGDPANLRAEARNEALLKLLTAALAQNLTRQNEAPVTLVVEEGWLDAAFSTLPEDGVIRHRAFPVDNFTDFGLTRSAEGEFYQQSADLLWSPAADGGGYIGVPAPPDLDVTRFRIAPADPPVAGAVTNDPGEEPRKSRVDLPRGYVVYNDAVDSATVIVQARNLSHTSPFVASVDAGRTTFPIVNSGVSASGSLSGVGLITIPVGDIMNAGISESAFSASGAGISIYETLPDGSLDLILTESPGSGAAP